MSPLEGTDFTNRKQDSLDLGSFGTKLISGNKLEDFIVKIDEKGRISLPADLRRSLGLDKGDTLILNFSLFKMEIVLRRGDSNG